MFVRLVGRVGRLVSAVPNIERPDPVCRRHLDGLIEQLDDAGRDAMVRRFFCSQKLSEMSAALNNSDDAARMRVERALARLRTKLALDAETQLRSPEKRSNSTPLADSSGVLPENLERSSESHVKLLSPTWNGQVGRSDPLFHISFVSNNGIEAGGWGKVGDTIKRLKLLSYDARTTILFASDQHGNVYNLTLVRSKLNASNVTALPRDTANKYLFAAVDDLIGAKLFSFPPIPGRSECLSL